MYCGQSVIYRGLRPSASCVNQESGPPDLAADQSDEGFVFIEIPSSQMTQAFVKKEKKTKPAQPPLASVTATMFHVSRPSWLRDPT